MQATGTMHLIFQGAITQFSQATKEELTSQRVERFSFIESDQDAATE